MVFEFGQDPRRWVHADEVIEGTFAEMRHVLAIAIGEWNAEASLNIVDVRR